MDILLFEYDRLRLIDYLNRPSTDKNLQVQITG